MSFRCHVTLFLALCLSTLSVARAEPLQSQGALSVVQRGPASSTPPRQFSPSTISQILENGSREQTQQPKAQADQRRSGKDSAVPVAEPARINALQFVAPNPTARGFDPVVLKAEILLDRNHAPPGVIDGRYGGNFIKAVQTFERLRNLPVDGKLTRRVWDELGGDDAAPVLVSYTTTEQDVVGPFYPDLSPDYAEQAKMPDLGYRSAEDMFGERFHMDHKFLKALNPTADLSVAGTVIVVAAVDTLPIVATVARIDVDKGAGQVLAFDPQGALVVAYPATIGSDDMPSPSGSFQVRGVAPHPTYTYDPKKNFQQGTNTQKLVLPPGPNNPVGAAFIALTKPTYGIHGTPDPTKIDKTHSHGCVRLTNWNAVELASLVRVGIPVNFIEKPAPPGDPALPGLVAAAKQSDGAAVSPTLR